MIQPDRQQNLTMFALSLKSQTAQQEQSDNNCENRRFLKFMLKADSKRAGCHVPSSILYMEDIFHHHIKVL